MVLRKLRNGRFQGARAKIRDGGLELSLGVGRRFPREEGSQTRARLWKSRKGACGGEEEGKWYAGQGGGQASASKHPLDLALWSHH